MDSGWLRIFGSPGDAHAERSRTAPGEGAARLDHRR
ncbi:hypothetical protein G3I41_02040 [Streptomyces sp. SID9727]|nr:hypothetical protein [Streptomyces sp. SID9727]